MLEYCFINLSPQFFGPRFWTRAWIMVRTKMFGCATSWPRSWKHPPRTKAKDESSLVYSPAVYISLSANWHQLQMLWELEKAKHIFAAEEVTKGITACTIKRSCCTWCGFHSDFCIDLKDWTCDSCNARTLPPRLIYIGTEIVKVRNPQERSERQGDEWRLIEAR